MLFDSRRRCTAAARRQRLSGWRLRLLLGSKGPRGRRHACQPQRARPASSPTSSHAALGDDGPHSAAQSLSGAELQGHRGGRSPHRGGDTVGRGMRDGSCRAGRALLGVWVKLEGRCPLPTRGCRSRRMLAAGRCRSPQAVVGRDAGFSLDAAEPVSGADVVTGLVSAAVRLGIIGHYRGAAEPPAARPARRVAGWTPPGADALPASFTPLSTSRSRAGRFGTFACSRPERGDLAMMNLVADGNGSSR